jgi:ATP-dependent helicase/nuclease subunit B
VDGQPIELIGRIDRIDVHEKSGEYAVFDYKTGDQARDPEDVHRSGEEWVDLQLPLYCRLVRAIAPQAVIQTGYILLPRSPGECGFVPANWSAELVAEAEECARRVVRAIRGGAFEPAARPPDFDDFADICGVGNLASALGGDDE